MAMAVQTTRFSGWYYRVLSEGSLRRGDAMVLLERPHADWPLTRLMAIILPNCQGLSDGDYQDAIESLRVAR